MVQKVLGSNPGLDQNSKVCELFAYTGSEQIFECGVLVIKNMVELGTLASYVHYIYTTWLYNNNSTPQCE